MGVKELMLLLMVRDRGSILRYKGQLGTNKKVMIYDTMGDGLSI